MATQGDSASIDFKVTDEFTAIALGSGDVPVLGTPKVVALCEEAAVAAITPSIDDGSTTVGTHIRIEHTAPTPVGATVVATAEVVRSDDRTVEFSVSVTQGGKEVACGSHTRAIVDRKRFLNGLS